MEILAQKQRGVMAQSIITVISGAVLIGLEIFLLAMDFNSEGLTSDILIPVIFLTAAGIGIIVMGIVTCLRIKKTPDTITLNGNQVDLGNGFIVNLSQIENVDYRESRGRYNRQRWGKLTVYLQNQKIDYYYMADVQHARDRIMQLVWQTGKTRGQIY